MATIGFYRLSKSKRNFLSSVLAVADPGYTDLMTLRLDDTV